MRKFCLILCLSLLTSMFHAAVMPTETLSGQTQTHTQAMQTSTPSVHGEHPCDEQAASPAIPAFKCAWGAHLCCLGLTATLANAPLNVSTDRNALINPVVLSLELQARANKLFKPPKRALLS